MRLFGNLDVKGSSIKIAHFRDEKASNTDPTAGGEAFIDDSWNARTINTTVSNDIRNCSLSSDQITLPAGRFFIQARAPAFNVNNTRLRIYDVTNATSLVVGPNQVVSTADFSTQDIHVAGVINGDRTIEIQQYVSSIGGGDSAGGQTANIVGVNEVYTEVFIIKV